MIIGQGVLIHSYLEHIFRQKEGFSPRYHLGLLTVVVARRSEKDRQELFAIKLEKRSADYTQFERNWD